MSRFIEDTRVEPVAGSTNLFRGNVSPDWTFWTPNGGYLAAMALRAVGRATALTRPASLTCHYVAAAQVDEIDFEVTCLRSGRTVELYRVNGTQGGVLVLTLHVWVTRDALEGYEFCDARIPNVPGPEDLKCYSQLADDFDGWVPYFRSVEGRPCEWEGPGPGKAVAFFQGWWRCKDTPRIDDPFLDAGRSVLWLDAMMWNAVLTKLTLPVPYLAPNLDLSVQFHQPAPEFEWLLHDARADIACHGVIGAVGRVWAPDGRLVATGGSQLLCRPNPMVG